MWVGSRDVDQNKHVPHVTGEKAVVGRLANHRWLKEAPVVYTNGQ